MTVRPFARLASLALFAVLGLRALGLPALAADPLTYDDPGMHYKAPDGWTRVDLGGPAAGAPQGGGDKRPPAAVFTWHRGEADQRTIVIDIQPFEGTLQGFESQHETDLRSTTDSTFVDKKTLTKLDNGMPAYFVKVSQGSDIGKFVRRYDYLVYDGQRSIDVFYIGRQGEFGDDDARSAFASLYVVLYPRNRP